MSRHRFARFGFSEEIIRYGFVATSSFTLDLVTLHLLFRVLHWPYVPAATVAFFAGACWNYIWAVNWAFAYRRLERRSTEFFSYWLIAVISFLATVVIMGYLHAGGMNIVEARVITAVVVAGGSFGSKKLFLFTNYQIVNEAYHWYCNAPLKDRLHVIIRRLTIPLARVLRYVPSDATRVLEIGSGHGIVLLTLANKRRNQKAIYRGVDIDARKTAIARGAAYEAKLPIQFSVGHRPPGKALWDVIIIVDVLYLLSPTEQQRLLRECRQALAPGGVLMIKEMGLRPRWKMWIVRLQEYLAIKLFKLTKRRTEEPLAYHDLPALAEIYRQQGKQAECVRLDKRWLYPHVLLRIFR